MIAIGYNGHAATRSLRDNLLRMGYGNYMVAPAIRGHLILCKPGSKFYVLYKRDFYQHFSKVFKEFTAAHPEFVGPGESINQDALERAMGCDLLVFIHPEGVWAAYPRLIKKFCETHGLTRSQDRINLHADIHDNGREHEENEITYSFPIALLQPIEYFLKKEGDL